MMKTIAGAGLLWLVGSLAVSAYSDLGNNVYQSNGTAADTQAAVDAAADGYTVRIPSGSFTWSSGVRVSGKGVKIRGAGSGRIVGRSLSSVSIGTGSKTFTTQSGLGLVNGQIIRVERLGNVGNYVLGTVTSYSGTSLQVNVTSTGGSGSHQLWIISTAPQTTIVHGAGSASLFDLTEDSTHSVEVSEIQFVRGSGSGDSINMNRSGGGFPIQVHDCWFRNPTSNSIYTDANRGIVWSCSFDASPFSMAPLAIHQKDGPTDSWTTPSTMGSADTTGRSNFYVEDCDFHAFLNATDFDDNGRSVVRHCVFNNAGFGTHGADTSNYGVRHYEVYDCEFIFNGFNNGTTFNLNWWFFLRGGTGVITDNIMPDISSTDYGNKLEINMTVMNLQRSGGPNGCWGAGIAGIQYPCPRQVGMGRVTGAAGNDSITYRGDSEPLYIWRNTGSYSAGTTDYGGCSSPDSTRDYVVAGRDYYNNGTAKPGYTKYIYPHPARSASSKPAPPQNVRVTSP